MGCCSTTTNDEEAANRVINEKDATKSNETDTKIVTNAEIDSKKTEGPTNTKGNDQSESNENNINQEHDETVTKEQEKQIQLEMTIEILESKNKKEKEKGQIQGQGQDQSKNTPKKYVYTPTNNSNLNTPMVIKQNGTIHTNGFQSSLDFNGTPMRELEQTMFGLLDQMKESEQ